MLPSCRQQAELVEELRVAHGPLTSHHATRCPAAASGTLEPPCALCSTIIIPNDYPP
jgi:hypothetical protein